MVHKRLALGMIVWSAKDLVGKERVKGQMNKVGVVKLYIGPLIKMTVMKPFTFAT